MRPLLVAAFGGALAALSLPPFGLFFLAPLGFLLLASTLADGSRRARFGRAVAFFLVYFAVGLAWMAEFTLIGAPLVVVLETLFMAAPMLLLPRRPQLALVALPALVTLGETLRYRLPFGGLPLGGFALGQVNSPLLPVARLAGDLGLVFVTVALGAGLTALLRDTGERERGLRVVGVALVLVAVAPCVVGWRIGAPGRVGTLRVAYAQGGGPRGLSSVENAGTDVYGNQVRATRRLRAGLDLVVWPEDVIDLPGPIRDDPIRDDVGAIAKQLGATLVAGVVEDSGETRFRNAAVAWDRSGKIVDRFEKVHRVPFGEYIPARGLVKHFADISAIPRDAIAGRGDGVLLTRHGELGVLISYEVFFADRALAAVHGGAQILLVPTNASSFRGRQVPAQEVAAARLRAVETGRDLVQAAPTGHSAFVTANGDVSAVSKLGKRAAASATLHRRKASTPFDRNGDRPMAIVIIGLLAIATVLDRTVKSTL